MREFVYIFIWIVWDANLHHAKLKSFGKKIYHTKMPLINQWRIESKEHLLLCHVSKIIDMWLFSIGSHSIQEHKPWRGLSTRGHLQECCGKVGIATEKRQGISFLLPHRGTCVCICTVCVIFKIDQYWYHTAEIK